MLLTLKNWIRITHIFFSVSFLIIYFINYYDLLIRRGFITEVADPFFLMGFVVHLPIIVFNIVTIIFLRKISRHFKG